MAVGVVVAVVDRLTMLDLRFSNFELPVSRSVAGNRGIDLERPAVDAASQTLCLNALPSQPARYVQAAHAVMAVNHHWGVLGYPLHALRDLGHRNQRGPFDMRKCALPWLAAVDEKQLLFRELHHRGQRLGFNLESVVHWIISLTG